MNWFELATNPDAIRMIYDAPPALSSVIIRELDIFGPYKPAIRLSLELPQPPTKPHNDPSAIGIVTLQLLDVSNLVLEGWPTEKIASIETSRSEDSEIWLEGAADKCSFSFKCNEFMIEAVGTYSDEKVQRNRRTLTSYPNVWNSCLIVLREQGFKLQLLGEPGPHRLWDYCLWRATIGDFVLTASNPIELLGLATIYERQNEKQPQHPRDNWWRVDGPDLASELLDELKRKWPGALDE